MTNPKTKRAETEHGKYVTVYQKQTDGSWKAVEDINNADAPAVAEAPAKKHVAAAPKKRRK
jgi:ketosteroid isomerase-like protein